MKLKAVVLASLFSFAASQASAGTFVNLTNGDGTNVSSSLGGFVEGTGGTASDQMYIQTVSATYEDGFGDVRPHFLGGSGDIVAKTINYRTYAPFDSANTTSTGTLSLVAWQVTRGVDLSIPGEDQADIFDFVYRDSADNKLVFGTRYLNRVDNDQEVNYLYRYGFEGFGTSVAWTFSSGKDLYMYSAAKTESGSSGSVFPLSEGTIRQQGDFSLTEDYPWSALLLVKTDAEYYKVGDKAIGFFQAGEEEQEPFFGSISGFVPTTAVPEPESYALMLLGVGVVTAFARRQKKQS